MKNRIEVRGDETIIYIVRKNGDVFETIIDTEDLGRLQEFSYTWCVTKSKGRSFYAYAGRKERGKQFNVLLHRFIMNPPSDMDIDHISHNTLDNRKSNLRITTRLGNHHNRRAKLSRDEDLLNIYWDDEKGMWNVIVDNKFIGYFKDLDEAKSVRDRARIALLELSPEYRDDEHERSLLLDRPADKPHQNNKYSKVKNVYWSEEKQKWFVRFRRNRTNKFLGYFGDLEDAKQVANNYRNTLS